MKKYFSVSDTIVECIHMILYSLLSMTSKIQWLKSPNCRSKDNPQPYFKYFTSKALRDKVENSRRNLFLKENKKHIYFLVFFYWNSMIKLEVIECKIIPNKYIWNGFPNLDFFNNPETFAIIVLFLNIIGDANAKIVLQIKFSPGPLHITKYTGCLKKNEDLFKSL